MNGQKTFCAEKFQGIERLKEKAWLATPTMHGDEQRWVDEAIRTNWVSTVGENINEVEQACARIVGRAYGVGLSCGTAALHLAIRLCGEKLYGQARVGTGTLAGRKVFCSDLTFDATVNPVAYEGGEAVFIDTDPDTWNMDPVALQRAFELYPDVKLVVVAHLYGLVGKIDEIVKIAHAHGALVVEDAAESFGATYRGVQTGTFGDVSIISFNGNKIVTGSAGGLLLTDSLDDANKVRKWSTQSREDAAWYQHEELGYNYRMSNIVAGVVRGNLNYLSEHIAQKKAVFERYRDSLRDLPLSMYPIGDACVPNFWLSCCILDQDAMCETVRGETEALYVASPGKSCPTEILEALSRFNAEGRPIWKPMHLQPIYRMHPFVTRSGSGRASTNAYIQGSTAFDVGADIFRRGLCLPSDNKLTTEQQDRIIEIIRRCFA